MNPINLHQIEEFVELCASNCIYDHSKEWFLITAKRYLLNSSDCHYVAKSLPHDAPLWAHEKWGNEILHIFRLPKFLEKSFKNITEWFNTKPTINYNRLGVMEAFYHASEYIERVEFRTIDTIDNISQKPVFEWNGYQFFHLISESELTDEGIQMNNCLADGHFSDDVGYDIWSIRNSKGKIVANIGISHEPMLDQIFGPENKSVDQEHMPAIDILLNNLNIIDQKERCLKECENLEEEDIHETTTAISEALINEIVKNLDIKSEPLLKTGINPEYEYARKFFDYTLKEMEYVDALSYQVNVERLFRQRRV